MSKATLNRVDPKAVINPSFTVNLIAYGGQVIQTLGFATLNLNCGSLTFQIVNLNVKSLLGLSDSIKLGLVSIGPDVHTVQQGAPELTKYKELFDNDTIGKLPVVYRMRIDETVHPAICAPRRVPLAMKDKVITELDRMTKLGVITPVDEATEWVSNMVAANKKDGKVRLCIDPVHLNKALLRPHHPMKTVEQVIADMPEARVFSVLDAKCGFWQIPLDEASSRLTTFITPAGRYRFLRMPYGISTGSEVFQRCMEQLFAGLPCEIIVDDVLVWGKSVEEHDARLHKVMDRMHAIGIKLNQDKCRFRVSEVPYVGHLLTSQGVRPDPEKTKAISLMPPPEDKLGLERFLGMTNYLSKFIQNYSELTAPLRELLHQDTDWCWLEHHEAAFSKLKGTLTSPPVLQYFDVRQPVVLSADASQHGLGAVCMQHDKPVAFASRALSDTESRYAQIEKELLALVFACQKFHDFIYGRPVTVETDHQPLITILKKPLHTASARLQRMMLKLQRYNLSVVYKRGKELYVADTLSRSHLPSTNPAEETDEYEVMAVEVLSSRRMDELRQETLNDSTCRSLAEIISKGWPDSSKSLPQAIKPFYAMRDELTSDNGLLLRGQRFIIPHSLQQYYLKQLHQGHPGSEATKRRAKESLYWPSMYMDIEREVSRCAPCNALKPHQQAEPLTLHEIPDAPWTITAADIFEWRDKEYLVLVDSFSGWFEVDHLHTCTSNAVIAKLKCHFATHGIPLQLMTDNARTFTSREFSEFARSWDLMHITSSPNYPQSNGLAERAVRSAKHLMEKCARDGTDFHAALLNLRNTPRDGLPSQAQRLMSRRTRTLIPMTKSMLLPVVQQGVHSALLKARQRGKDYHDKSARTLQPLAPGQTARMQTTRGYDRLCTVVRAAPQPNSFYVKAGEATYVRNRRHLLKTTEVSSDHQPGFQHLSQPDGGHLVALKDTTATSAEESTTPPPPHSSVVQTDVTQQDTTTTRYGRVSKPNPKYLD